MFFLLIQRKMYFRQKSLYKALLRSYYLTDITAVVSASSLCGYFIPVIISCYITVIFKY